MKDISMIRIFRYALAMMIVLTMVAYSNPANAETGTVTINFINSTNTTRSDAGSSGTTDFTKFRFDVVNYNSVSDFTLVWASTAQYMFLKQSNFTFFTCAAPNVCSGGASYSNNSRIMDWSFDPGSVITQSPIELVYETNIFDANNIAVGPPQNPTTVGIAADLPMCLYHSTGSGCTYAAYATGAYVIKYYIVDVVLHTTVDYSISYPFSGKYTGTITKNGQIFTKISMQQSDGTIDFNETTFNNQSFSLPLLDYGEGLYINATTSKAYTLQLINSTNAGLPATQNVPANNTVNGVGLVWAFNTYSLDETGNLSWSKTTPSLACDNIKIYNPSNTLKATINNPANSGSYKILLTNTGTWKAEFRRQTLCYVGNEEVLNTAYTTVSDLQPTYLIINATTIAGKQENVTYRWDRTMINFETPYLAVVDSQGNPEGKFSISGFQKNVEGTSPVVILTAGQHTIRICDSLGCDDAVAVTNTVYNTTIPTEDITASNITMDSSVYSFEDHAIVKYAVDNTNFSNKAIYTTSFNWDYGIETTRYLGFVNQTGTLDEHLSIFLGRYTYPGLYSYRLMGRNDTGAYILAFWNFTISSIDGEGYGLSLSKDSLCMGDSLTMIVNSPTISYLNISHNTNGNIFNSYQVNMNKTISYKPSAIGTYSVILYSPEWYTKRAFTFEVSSCITPTPTPGATQGAQQAKAMADMLMSNVFWSFIITAGLMIAIAWRTGHGMATAAIGALSMTVFASIGWFPLWAFFSIVIICALLLSAKWAANFFDIGTSD